MRTARDATACAASPRMQRAQEGWAIAHRFPPKPWTPPRRPHNGHKVNKKAKSMPEAPNKFSPASLAAEHLVETKNKTGAQVGARMAQPQGVKAQATNSPEPKLASADVVLEKGGRRRGRDDGVKRRSRRRRRMNMRRQRRGEGDVGRPFAGLDLFQTEIIIVCYSLLMSIMLL